LMLAFTVVLGLTLALGGFALYSLAKVKHASDNLALKWMPSVGYATTARTAILEFRDFEAKHARAADASYMAEYEDKMTASLAIINTQLAGYEKLLGGADERTLHDAFMKSWNAYLVIHKNVVSLGRANKQQDAKDINEGASQMGSDESIQALDKLTAFNFEGGKLAAERATQTYNSARLWAFALLGSAVLIGALLATLITRGLLRTLGGEPTEVLTITTAITRGDLSTPISVAKGTEQSVMAGMVAMQQSLRNVVSAVRQGSEGVATASAEIAQGNNDLSARTEQQASALEETAASMEELSSTVKQNADSARQANQLAMSASTVAVKGGQVVAQVVDTMKGINVSSRKISDIISVIDGIAFQTNILALNAAVEAARAGEQGRGFAVVASEVRSLAGRSAEAAKEIKNLIGASVERVEQGTALVDQAGVTVTEVVSSIKRVTDLMGEISAASNEQSLGVAQVGEAVTQMDQATQQNAALVEQMAAAASSLKGQAQELVQTVAVFKLGGQEHAYSGGASSPSPRPTVRSNLTAKPANAGIERRQAAPRPVASKAMVTAQLASPTARPTVTAKAKPAGGDDDWETF
jgi:methyl-accepting chemotaxis protein